MSRDQPCPRVTGKLRFARATHRGVQSNCLWMSRTWSNGLDTCIVPWSAMFEHGVQDGKQLTHASGKGYFLGLAGGTQAMVEGTDDGVVASSYQGSHVESRPYRVSPTPNRALA